MTGAVITMKNANVTLRSTMNIKKFIVVNNLVVGSYWVLFIIAPTLLIAILVITFNQSKLVIALSIVTFLITGEHGIRKWASHLESGVK